MRKLLQYIKNLFCRNKKEIETDNAEKQLDPNKHVETEITALGFTLASDFDCVHGRAYERKRESKK